MAKFSLRQRLKMAGKALVAPGPVAPERLPSGSVIKSYELVFKDMETGETVKARLRPEEWHSLKAEIMGGPLHLSDRSLEFQSVRPSAFGFSGGPRPNSGRPLLPADKLVRKTPSALRSKGQRPLA
ncbi:MAG: hypothetical protein HYU30_10560 [Chloroflexi bacterium]|nr:hypothetical protein [Chloroflexota bacterium]